MVVVHIHVETEEQVDLILSSVDECDDKVRLQISNEDDALCVTAKVDDLKTALRKITTK